MNQSIDPNSPLQNIFLPWNLFLPICILAMHGNKVDKTTGDFVEKIEGRSLRDKNTKKNEQIDPRIYMVADYIILHPSEKYTPQKMAEMAELSKQRFSSLFKINMGKSPMEYVREIRLATAARALLVSNDNIKDIAENVPRGTVFKASDGIG